ncbi:hypothetical protein [Streptomyces sp. NPDC005374]
MNRHTAGQGEHGQYVRPPHPVLADHVPVTTVAHHSFRHTPGTHNRRSR